MSATASPPSQTFALVGSRLDLIVTAEQTGGQFALVAVTAPPNDPGPPPHTHTREDETFYVVDGSLVINDEGVERTLQAGQCFFAARNRRHKFANPTDRPIKVLLYINPAADDGFYGYIHAAAEPGPPHGPPTEAHIGKVLELAPRYGITIHV